MKRIGIFLIILAPLLVNKANSQISFDSVWINLTFENEADTIIIFSNDTNSTTQWQVGNPSKANFNSAYSPVKVITTDTFSNYQPNTNTWFEIPVVPNNYDTTFLGVCPLNICFQHKLDFDSLHSGGWIELRDNDESFNLGQFDNGAGILGNYYHYDFIYGFENIYSVFDTLFNDSLGFPNRLLSWTKTCYSLGMEVRADRTLWDTIFFRFNFASDSTVNSIHEGWMIDDIVIGKGLGICAGGMEDELDLKTEIFPNPVTNTINLELMAGAKMNSFIIMDLRGQVIVEQVVENDQEMSIDVSNLNVGVYFIKFQFDKNIITKKFIKQ